MYTVRVMQVLIVSLLDLKKNMRLTELIKRDLWEKTLPVLSSQDACDFFVDGLFLVELQSSVAIIGLAAPPSPALDII